MFLFHFLMVTLNPTFSLSPTLSSAIDAANLDTFHEPIPSLNCFDDVPPPAYPHTKALSSYSAVIQLYLRSGQLDTTLSCSARLNDDRQPWCRFGCPTFEDPHHIFTNCSQFTSLRTLRASELYSNVNWILDASATPPPDRQFVQDRVKYLFLDLDIWPARRSLFYLGILPPLFPPAFHKLPIHIRVVQDCHTASIRLAAQIWGAARRSYSKIHFGHNCNISHIRTTLTLPSIFFRVLPPSPSYPSFSIAFTWFVLGLHTLQLLAR